MQLKKVELTLDYGEGEVCEVRHFSADLKDEEITERLLEGEYSYGPTPQIKFAGEVEAAEELGDDFKEDDGAYFTSKEWGFMLNDAMEDKCPGAPN